MVRHPIVVDLQRHAAEFPAKMAIAGKKKATTYGELLERVQSGAAFLANLGVSAGDRVVLAASSSPAFVYGYFATHWLGAIAVPVDPKIGARRLNYIVNEVKPKAIFTRREFRHGDYRGRLTDEFERVESSYPRSSFSRLDDVADVLFTTGTTGKPKGVVLTHRNIASAAANINTVIQNGSADREVVPLPLSHSFGLGRLRCNILAGGAIIMAEGFTVARRIYEAIETWEATGFSFVPAGLAVLLRVSGDKIGEYSSQLKYVEIGSAPMSSDQKRHLMSLLPNTKICMHYGLTEASRSTFLEFHASSENLESIGRPSPSISVRIVDERGKEVPSYQQGEIVVSGAPVTTGYWRNPELTAACLVDGWFHTEDMGYMDRHGYLYLVGRRSDVINVGGLKVAPSEIEEILKLHDAIEECACIGIPDKEGVSGELVKAFLVANPHTVGRPSNNELVNFVRGKVEPYKIPSEFEWTNEIPKTLSGKLQRGRLRSRHATSTVS